MNMKHVCLLALTFPKVNNLNHLYGPYLRPLHADTITWWIRTAVRAASDNFSVNNNVYIWIFIKSSLHISNPFLENYGKTASLVLIRL